MPSLNRWFGRKGQAASSTHSSPSFGSGTADGGAVETAAQSTAAKIPDAVHQDEWDALRRNGDFNLKPGCSMAKEILLLVLGAPGVGKKALVKTLLYGDMLGGDKLEMAMLVMEDEVPRYYCDGYIYSLKVMLATDLEASLPAMFPRYDYFGLVLGYDVDSRASLDLVSQLRDRIVQGCREAAAATPTVLLGLKSDLAGHGSGYERTVPPEEGRQVAQSWGCHFSECSSKTGHGVYESFGYFVKEAHMANGNSPASRVEAFERVVRLGLLQI